MNDLFASLPYIGDLFYHNIYLFYDEPQIFSCINKSMQQYFIVTVPAENDESSAWILVPISPGKLLKAEKNAIEIRDLLLNPESLIFRVRQVKNIFFVKQITPEFLTDDLLPESGELLDFDKNMELLPSNTTPFTQASQEMRDIIEISLEKDDTHISEISCVALSEVLSNVQQLIYALAFKEGGLRGTIPKKVKEDCCLYATSMFAASVGVRLKSGEICDLYKETPLTQTLQEFNKLFISASDKEQLRQFLSMQNPRVAVKYRNLIKSLLSNNTGIKINSASPNNKTFIKHFSINELSRSLDFINSEIEEIVENEVFYGQLVGVNIERRSFEFITNNDEKITGKIADSLTNSIFSVPQSIEAGFEIRVGIDQITREEKLLYTLNSVRSHIATNESED